VKAFPRCAFPPSRTKGRSKGVVPFTGNLIGSSGKGIAKFFRPSPKRARVSESTPTSSSRTSSYDTTDSKCKACGQSVTGSHVCSVCQCPLDSPSVCTKKMRIKVIGDVYWCEDCAVEDVVAEPSLSGADTDELDDVVGFKVAHKSAKKKRPAYSTRTLRSRNGAR
jgi:hypothetical protein